MIDYLPALDIKAILNSQTTTNCIKVVKCHKIVISILLVLTSFLVYSSIIMYSSYSTLQEQYTNFSRIDGMKMRVILTQTYLDDIIDAIGVKVKDKSTASDKKIDSIILAKMIQIDANRDYLVKNIRMKSTADIVTRFNGSVNTELATIHYYLDYLKEHGHNSDNSIIDSLNNKLYEESYNVKTDVSLAIVYWDDRLNSRLLVVNTVASKSKILCEAIAILSIIALLISSVVILAIVGVSLYRDRQYSIKIK